MKYEALKERIESIAKVIEEFEDVIPYSPNVGQLVGLDATIAERLMGIAEDMRGIYHAMGKEIYERGRG